MSQLIPAIVEESDSFPICFIWNVQHTIVPIYFATHHETQRSEFSFCRGGNDCTKLCYFILFQCGLNC